MSEISTNKTAIVLFNLGGPDSLKSVRPFLFNLFNDKAIIRIPKFFRYILARLISFSRNKKSQKIYSLMGGKSPILDETLAQKVALENKLKETIKDDFMVFVSMRYWHPFSEEAIDKIHKYNPSSIILLPLYPQFSTTTTASSVEDFMLNLKKKFIGEEPKVSYVCCYPEEENFIKAHVSLIKEAISKLKNKSNFRILFSAHSLPVKIIKSGDPYQWHIEKTVETITRKLAIQNLDYKITFQSKVGPVEWLSPSTDKEIEIAGKESKGLIIVPISFVSEHSETLVELGIDYKEIANKYGIEYINVPALSVNEKFIESLSGIVLKLLKTKNPAKFSVYQAGEKCKRICPNEFNACPCKIN